MNDNKRVGVLGAGLMGSGIVEVCARSGCRCDLLRGRPARPPRPGRKRVEASLDRAVAKGKISEADATATTLGRIRYTTDLDDLADRQLTFEAVVEDEQIKLDLFARLDKVVTDPEAILSSNTSSIPIMKLAMATAAPTGSSACTSSTRRRCSRWSSWCRRCSPRRRPRPRPSGSPPRCSARR